MSDNPHQDYYTDDAILILKYDQDKKCYWLRTMEDEEGRDKTIVSIRLAKMMADMMDFYPAHCFDVNPEQPEEDEGQ